MGSIALSSVLLLSSLPGFYTPVEAAEHPAGLESVILQNSFSFSAKTNRSKLIASASLVPIIKEEERSSQPIQVVADVKMTEVESEVEPQTKTEAKTESKPATSTTTPQKTVQVASAAIASQVSRGETASSEIVRNAQSLQGVPYVFGGTTRSGFDCSGFTQYVYKGSGISLPRTSYSQFSVGTAVQKDQLQLGDLVFFSTYDKGASHVGIYIGGGSFVHASNSGVRTTSLSDSYYLARYLGARRVQ